MTAKKVPFHLDKKKESKFFSWDCWTAKNHAALSRDKKDNRVIGQLVNGLT